MENLFLIKKVCTEIGKTGKIFVKKTEKINRKIFMVKPEKFSALMSARYKKFFFDPKTREEICDFLNSGIFELRT